MKTNASLLLAGALLLLGSCHAQNDKNNDPAPANKSLAIHNDSTRRPDVRYKVNKQLDAKGNVIRYDSTYSYVYSGPVNGQLNTINDSLFGQLNSFFGIQYPGFFNGGSNNLFYQDSLFKPDFFNDDHFLKGLELQRQYFEQLYKQMESMKSGQWREPYPKGYPKKNEI